MRLFASESATRESWNQKVALCLPFDQCAMNRRAVLTELGPDVDALRDEDRGSILFDLGLDALQADLCVRVADQDLAERLRPWLSRSLFEPGNPAAGIILGASPHRVFISRLGRAEVFQAIPAADGKSPEGPHTHLLPKLLAHKRTHPATEPIPEGWVPCAHLYPEHPAKDGFGRQRPFDAACHDAFQDVLRRYGNSELIDLKERIFAAVRAGEGPSTVALANRRPAKTIVRVALRQLQARAIESPSMQDWIAAFEHPVDGDRDADIGDH